MFNLTEKALAAIENDVVAAYKRWRATIETPVQQPKAIAKAPASSGALRALRAHRTRLERQLKGSSTTVRRQLKARIAEYDTRISA